MDEPRCRACLVYDESLTSYNFGPAHPMNPVRVDLTIALAGGLGVLDRLATVPAPDATDDDLVTVHHPGLIEAVMASSAAEAPSPARSRWVAMRTGAPRRSMRASASRWWIMRRLSSESWPAMASRTRSWLKR